MIVDGEKLKREFHLWAEMKADQQDHDEFDEIVEHCKAPIQPPVEDPERSRRARIEAAIRHFEGKTVPMHPCDTRAFVDLLHWVLGQPQPTWEDKDLGLEEETKK